MNQPIGFLDSGVGGLTVVKEMQKQLPKESFIYIGDNARCPYGPRSSEEIARFTMQLVGFLLKKNIKLLVIACNTATAVCFEHLQAELDIPVVGMIDPGARGAMRMTTKQGVGIIGTEATIVSKQYQNALTQKNPQLRIHSLACPSFVNLVESGEIKSAVAKKTVAKTLLPLKSRQLDTLILGCTHFPLLSDLIQKYMGEEVALVNPGQEAIGEVSFYLDRLKLNDTGSKKPSAQFYTTGSVKLFNYIAYEWLGEQISANYITLEALEEK